MQRRGGVEAEEWVPIFCSVPFLWLKSEQWADMVLRRSA